MAANFVRIALALLLTTPAWASTGLSGPDDVSPATVKHAKAGKKGKKRKAHAPVFSGFHVPLTQLRQEPLPRPSGKLNIVNANTNEALSVELYGADGNINEESLEALNHFWHCRRTGTERSINPHLFEILSIIADHFEGRAIELISGFRNQPHTTSYHFIGSASDIRVHGIAERELQKFVATLDMGNMGLGLYPHAHFIHVDVRPETSYRWVDYSPPSENMGHPKRHHRPTS